MYRLTCRRFKVGVPPSAQDIAIQDLTPALPPKVGVPPPAQDIAIQDLTPALPAQDIAIQDLTPALPAAKPDTPVNVGRGLVLML